MTTETLPPYKHESSDSPQDPDTAPPSLLKRLLIACAIGFGVWLVAYSFWNYAFNDTVATEVDPATPAFKEADLPETAHRVEMTESPLTEVDAQASKHFPLSPEQPLSTPVGTLERIDKGLKTLQTNLLAQSSTGLNQEQLAQQLQPLSASITALTAQLTGLEKKLTELRPAAATKVQRKLNRIRRRPSQSLPFTLVSIDAWGDQQNAVLRVNGQIKTLRQGDPISGWTLDKIDPDQLQAWFTYPKRRKPLILKING